MRAPCPRAKCNLGDEVPPQVASCRGEECLAVGSDWCLGCRRGCGLPERRGAPPASPRRRRPDYECLREEAKRTWRGLGRRPTRRRCAVAGCGRAVKRPCREWTPDVEGSVDRPEDAD
ncbi:hypothetical protein NDU88_000353 [Pleurodeles waltl]|uniref:Uncharacterized protein n=1 Tax=Pleurodeles waltl TaxID=8319 RepID=A0AAV7TEV5_PLEWA|nr:hypothetical protein NDU88_000353 [Pleurodeles waltl]